jgi:hypothetical protein
VLDIGPLCQSKRSLQKGVCTLTGTGSICDSGRNVEGDQECKGLCIAVQISVSRTGPYGSLAAKNGPTGSAYITFRRIEDARHCIESIHGTVWEGKPGESCV